MVRRGTVLFFCVVALLAVPFSAHAAWTVLVDNQAISTPTSETRSLRAIAVTPDGTLVYASYIQGTNSSEVIEYDSTTGTELRSFRVSTAEPAVSIAVDDRGIIYAGRAVSNSASAPPVRIFSSNPTFVLLSEIFMATNAADAFGHDKRPRGIKAVKLGIDYYLYTAGASSTSGYINRFNVNDPSNPVADNTFSGDGLVDLVPLDATAVNLRGLDVAADGTIYVASIDGKIFKVSPDLLTITSATMPDSRPAHDVALDGALLYVSIYDGASSRVEVYNATTLAHVETIDVLTESGTTRGSAEGFPGIEVGPDGRVFVADQLYLSASPNFHDRIFVSSAAAPTIDSVTPTSGPTAGGTAVTIEGSNFQSGATVTFGTDPCTGLIVVDAETITCTTPAHAAGLVDVTVTNPDTQSDVLEDGFTFVAPAPTIDSVTPTSGPTAGGTAVTIEGSNFQSGATVTFGTDPCTGLIVVDAETITCTTPAHAAGTVDVTVTNSDTQSDVLEDGFTFVAPAPTIDSVTPTSGPTAGGTAVTIEGSNFQSGATVTFGTDPCTGLIVVDAETITCTTP
ncbi:MAG TPA: IPT/TIG domain-containing protein, partial [Thermoanaerobaculia bacterium]